VLLSFDGCNVLNNADEFSFCVSSLAFAAQPQFVEVKGAKSTRFDLASDKVVGLGVTDEGGVSSNL
jgi:hypothetical protein